MVLINHRHIPTAHPHGCRKGRRNAIHAYHCMFLIGVQNQRLVLVHLGTQGSGDILRTGHELPALIVQTQYTGIPLTGLPPSG